MPSRYTLEAQVSCRKLRLKTLFMVAATLLLSISPKPAWAQAMALDPLNRLHLGVVLADGPTPVGFNLGMDSRLTRLVFVDAGLFGTPWAPGADANADGPQVESMVLRHGIHISPGLRLPHRNPAGFTWDLVARAGMAVVSMADLTSGRDTSQGPPFHHPAEAAGLFGADLTILRSSAGLRISYKHFFAAPYMRDEARNRMIFLPQLGLEALVQFGGAR